MNSNRVMRNGLCLMFLAILLSAFGAHGLRSHVQDPARIADFQLAGQYQIYHSLGLILLSLWAERNSTRNPSRIAFAFYGGIFFFSGSLYLLGLTGEKMLGAITPIGGLCFLAGWLLWALQAGKRA